MEIFGADIRIYFLLFIIYSILGWCMEVTLWKKYLKQDGGIIVKLSLI